MGSRTKSKTRAAVARLTVLLLLAFGVALFFFGDPRSWHLGSRSAATPPAKSDDRPGQHAEESKTTAELSAAQQQAVTVAPVQNRDFKLFVDAVGSIDSNQNLSLQIYSQYQGKVIKPLVEIGDHVVEGQPLFTVDSPDLLTAQATLLQTAGVLDLTNRNLVRLKGSVKIGGGSQKDLDQATSDQQTAQGAFASARDALRIFGMNEVRVSQLLTDRKVDSTLVVKSPITGIITARAAAPGTLVQPGVAPAPYAVTNDTMVRMYAYIVERDIPAMKKDLDVAGRVVAYPDRVFRGKITIVGATVDPGTRRLQVQSLIGDPGHLLRPGMFANLLITTGPAVSTASIPVAGVVREGDGTLIVWVQTSGGHFSRRPIRIGLQQQGFDQVLDGLRAGELVVTDNAVLLSNIANAGATE